MLAAKLSDVLKGTVAKPNEVYLDGVPVADPEDATSIRLYPDPTNGTSYYIIKMADVLKTEQWEPEEMRHAGHMGSHRFRLTVAITAKLLSVSVQPVDASTLACYNTCKVTCGNGYVYNGSCASGYRADCNVNCPNKTGTTTCTKCNS